MARSLRLIPILLLSAVAVLNSGCNLEQFFEKKLKKTTDASTDESLDWTINPVIYPTTGVNLTSKVFGSVNRSTATVELYSNSNCSSLITTGTASEIQAGLVFAASPNTAIDIHAKIVDSASNTESDCEYVGQYLSVPPTVSSVYPTNGANWNDYVVNNGSTIFNGTGAACTGAEANGYLSCLHGAEMKKVPISGADSCSGLSISDSLNAFIWSCRVVSGTATFYSTALKPFKGLKDLISGTSWRNLSVTVVSSAGSISSPSSAWWSNTITALPNNLDAGVASLSSSGTIYSLSTSRATPGYAITASKVSIVSLGGAVLSYQAGANNFNSTTALTASPNTRAVIALGSQNFAWIEANISGASETIANYLVLGRGPKHLHVKNSNLRVAQTSAIDLNGVSKAAIVDTKVTNSVFGSAIYISNSADNIVARVHVSNSATGLYFESSPRSSVSEFTSVSTDSAGLTAFADQINVAGATVLNSGWNAIDHVDSNSSTIHNSLSINSGGAGINAQKEVSNVLTGNTWSQIAVGHSDSGLSVTNSQTSKVTGNLLFVSNSANCEATDSGSGFDSSCANAGLGNATILQSAGTSLATSIVGKVSSDSQNASDTTNGATNYPAPNTIGAFDFMNFESWFRAWGRDGTSFLSSNWRGRFSSNFPGRIWDTRLYTNDTLIFNRTHALGSANAAITSGAACPQHLRGDVFLTDAISRKYLKNAIEFVGDNLGDEDGLCESNETCVYTPNFGAYQGEGDLFANSCTFSDNGDSVNNVTGVTVYFYPTNGVP